MTRKLKVLAAYSSGVATSTIALEAVKNIAKDAGVEFKNSSV